MPRTVAAKIGSCVYAGWLPPVYEGNTSFTFFYGLRENFERFRAKHTKKTRGKPNFVKAKSRTCDESCYLRIEVVILPREPLSEESRSFVTLLLSESLVQIHNIGRFYSAIVCF
jgi:hypothetical protein